jgi:methylglutaconyl-CoA hydratase
MKEWSYIIAKAGLVSTIDLNRPEVHHALHIEMIRELTQALDLLGREKETRIVVIRSSGPHFCAGADLQWMRAGLDQSREQLYSESLELARLFRTITEIPPLVITAVQGQVRGGALGLVAASDLVIAEREAVFAFPEVKLGLLPATIAPYVVRKAGEGKSADWIYTGRPFQASEAQESGLVHYLCPQDGLNEEVDKLLNQLLTGGPVALREIKRLFSFTGREKDMDRMEKETSMMIARARVSEEGQEGLNAFFNKRKPYWNDPDTHS